ncbi:MAG: tetratricopeptide (TPR) repeat protein [Cellvibrionaceae bacterium]|jgi:tetratricopeptide (TPR) repeat protein
MRFLILVYFMFLGLAACTAPVKPETSKLSSDSYAQQVAKRQKPAPIVYGAFTEKSLYSLLVAELAVSRQQYDLALNNYIEEAKATGDVGIIARAARLAQYFRRDRQALEMGKLWVDRAPENIEANILMATAHIQLRQPLDALNYAETILASPGPDQDRNVHSTAITETIANFSRNADGLTLQALVERYRQLTQRYPSDLSTRVGLSILYESQGNTSTAYEIIEQVLLEDGQYMPALMQEVRLLQASQQTDLAIDKLKAQLGKRPNDLRLRLLYARLLTQTDINAAYEEFTRLSAQSPRHLDIKFSRALIALELEKWQVAERLLTELLQVPYRQNAVRFYLGNLAEATEDLDGALRYYFAIIDGENYTTGHSLAARILAKQGRIADAQIHFKRLRQQSPERRPELYITEAEILQTLGYLDLALMALDRGVTEYPDNIDLRYVRSGFYEQMDKLQLMESDLRHILALEPENATALNALGYFLTNRTQRYEEALQLITMALELQPDNAAIMDSMGWVLFKLGRNGEAIDYLRRALEQFPDPEIAAHLGEALWVNGDKQDARAIWSDNLKENPEDRQILDTMRRLRATP